MKQRILSNWNFMRLLRLGLGLAIMVQAVWESTWTLGFVGLLLTAMPVLNIGCCGSTGCSISSRKSSEPSKNVEYEEVVQQ